MKIFRTAKAKVITAATAAIIVSGGFITYAAGAATTAPAPGNLYGCITSTRSIEHAYTTETNFVSFLNANGGKCPDGFPFSVVSGQTMTPSPTPTSTSPTPTPTTATPTPTPTTATPTPTSTTATATPTPTGAPKYELTSLDRAQTPIISDPNVNGGSNDSGPSVRQEVWNLKPALRKQDTKVWGPGNWTTTINAAAGNTEVNSYPDVSDTVTQTSGSPNPVSRYTSLVSTYVESMHANSGTDAETAYDIWLNNYNNELMIWVDNHGQTPAGSDTGKTIAVGGNTYHVWNDGTNHDTVSLVLDHNAPSGTTDILGIVKALQGMGYYVSSAGFDQIDFGFEAPSTGGVDETFAVTGYTLKYS